MSMQQQNEVRDFDADIEGDEWRRKRITGRETGDTWFKFTPSDGKWQDYVMIKAEDTCDQIDWR